MQLQGCTAQLTPTESALLRALPVPAAPWVKAPSVLLLHHGGRPLEMSVDAASLPEGLHFTGKVKGGGGGVSFVRRGWSSEVNETAAAFSALFICKKYA